MGLSSNQARFLSLTSRQIDLEKRIQQICQRRLRLSSELENVATHYNNSISNRRMFVPSAGKLQDLSIDTLKNVGFKVINTNTQRLVGTKPPTAPLPNAIEITSQAQFLQIVNNMNTNGAGLDKNYILQCDIDLSSYNTGGKALIQGAFTGNFDGNCYQIKNLNINNTDPSTNPTGSYYSCNSTDSGVGMFEKISGGSVANLELSDINITVNGNTQRAGALAGVITGTAQVSNISVSDTTISGSTDSKGLGGLAGYMDGGTVSNCSADAAVTGAWSIGGLLGLMNGGTLQNSEALGSATINQATLRSPFPDDHRSDRMAGGLAGAIQGGTVSQCYSDATVSNTSNSYAGGIAGLISGTNISNTYATGTVAGGGGVGGFAGDIRGSATFNNCYAQNTISASGQLGGFFGSRGGSGPGIITNSFYDSSLYTGGNFGLTGDSASWTNVAGIPTANIDSHTGSYPTVTAGWDTTNIWDTSEGAPTLRNVGYSAFGANVEDNLRSGRYSLIREADEYTQDPITIDDTEYEQVDWRSAPQIFDELYRGDDVEAENKYDKLVEEINAQDKKLQLEQTSVEVEYKAISSERESVKKILDTNAQNSFKYFS